jgi:uncharacterized protein
VSCTDRATTSSEDGIINLLFIGHGHREGQGGYHLSHVNAPLLNEALGREMIFMDYRENLDLLTVDGLASVDAIMLYANYDVLAPEQEAALLGFVENGGAFLPIHSASASFGHSDVYVKLVGGRFQSHGLEDFTARIAPGQENHPIMQGFEEFETRDETYVHSDHNEEGRTVLMYREDEPWTWVREQGAGRVFYTAYGHDRATWEQPAFHDLLIRGILWSVGEEKRNFRLSKSIRPSRYEIRFELDLERWLGQYRRRRQHEYREKGGGEPAGCCPGKAHPARRIGPRRLSRRMSRADSSPKRAASCSVMAPASSSASTMVTARR